MPERLPDYLAVLNPEQRRAVLHTGNPLLILAGAGSGKTRVITTKIAWLIREQAADPRSILAVTFTNKAAREMAGRARLIDERASGAMLRTFHSFGAWFLRRNGQLAGLDSSFVIYDDDDTVALLASIMEGRPRVEVKTYAAGISRAKDMFLSPDNPALDLIDSRSDFRKVYSIYESRLAKMGNVDFGDLIKKPVEILRGHPDTARRIRDRFRVIMVDEYQDANTAQFELLKILWEEGRYLCVVGDDDQSIYRFRGADVENILQFPQLFPNVDIIRLERNYRSTEPILAAASSVVGRNRGRLGKTLVSQRGPGKKPVLAFLPTQDEEAEFCAELIEKSVKSGAVYSDWAVLYRTNAQSMGFENEFLRRRVPYRVVGSLKFYEREEVKDALALLAFLVNPKDEVAFRRVANKPARGLGPQTVERILAARDETGDIAQAAKRAAAGLSAKARAGVRDFLAAIDAGKAALADCAEATHAIDAHTSGGGLWKESAEPRERLRGEAGLSLCLVRLLEASGVAEYHRSREDVSGSQRLGNLQELANGASMYDASREGLAEFLEHIELDRAIEDNQQTDANNAVTLITLHNTKGLEFRRVIMTGVETGVFPRLEKKGDDLEEERRLFYVGATRAMDELYFTSCAVRRVFGQTRPMEPGMFLREIDPAAVTVIGNAPPGFAGTGRGAAPSAAREKRAVSSDGRWAVGDRVFHDDRGYGAVTAISEEDEGPVVRVRFDTGGETRFLSRHQSRAFTKASEDS
jgi:DNA helicase-2/ATP-dependent DNA helicase PcrA